MKTNLLGLGAVVALVLSSAAAAGADAPLNVAVFNFRMKSKSPAWKWLEKGLADRIATDLAQSRKLNVTARDEMQLLAQKLAWVPEMAMTDPARMAQIREQLRIRYLVSGVYDLAGGELRIIGQIVEVETRKEVARKAVTGKADDVLKLQRQLSAQLLSWFTAASAEQILKKLPVWTESVPATKALYHGVDLYDEGRYAEAWLKFRGASASDPGYLEALYWTGKMYYFMNRYRHAREAYERFVYLAGRHPRVGDAIKEYLHTYEKLDTDVDTLLGLYAHLAKRYPDATIFNAMWHRSWVPNECWLKAKSGQLLGQIGRHKAAALAAAEAAGRLRALEDSGWGVRAHYPEGAAYRVAMRNMQTYNLLTGRTLMPPGLACHYRGRVLRFDETKAVAEYREDRPGRCGSWQTREGKTRYSCMECWHFALAPEGYVFKEMILYPQVEGTGGRITVLVHKDTYEDVASPARASAAEARTKGLIVKDLPQTGVLYVMVSMLPDDPWRKPNLVYRGLRVAAKFEKAPSPHGAVEVFCNNTSNFRVDVGGRMGRKYAGLVGLLPAGEHTVRLRSTYPEAPFDKWQTSITIKPGKTVRLIAQLPWKQSSPWAKWSGVVVGRDYEGFHMPLRPAGDPPTIQADAHAIRIIWDSGDDLWCTASYDGKTFTRPRKLPIPVSTGWMEHDPRLLRDESGRFVLVFRSDRNALYQRRPYLCWSRDFEHWSAPVMITDRQVGTFDVIQDDRGRFLWADGTLQHVTIMASRNGYNWKRLVVLKLPSVERGVRIVQRKDGRYELFVAEVNFLSEEPTIYKSRIRVHYFLSDDAVQWRPVAGVGEFPPIFYMSAVHDGAHTTLGLFHQPIELEQNRCRFWRPGGKGVARLSPTFVGVTDTVASMAFHPRWGYMIAWQEYETVQFPRLSAGPYLLRGPSVKGFFRPQTTMPANAPGSGVTRPTSSRPTTDIDL